MVVCPHCQSENSGTDKFCQNCGGSLAVWWAIIQSSHRCDTQEDLKQLLASGDKQFLDPQRRYRFLSPSLPHLPSPALSHGELQEVQAQVVDEQPLTDTIFTPAKATSVTPTAIADLFPQVHLVPTVQPYLVLHPHFSSTLPSIHDAWQQDGHSVLIIEDRSQLTLLASCIEQGSVPTLQILHWFHEMVELWTELESWECRRSLLELSNLRVDEDGLLCLQRLYKDTNGALETTKFQLCDLGKMWHVLFERSHPAQVDEQIHNLIRGVTSGVITTASDLQIALEQIAYEVQQPQIEEVTNDSLYDLGELDPSEPDLMDWAAEEDELGADDLDIPTIVLPMKLSNIENACLTDVGKQRNHNEDFYSVDTQVIQTETLKYKTLCAKGIYILCDGMGGHAGGEVASALAVETIRDFFKDFWQDKLPDQDTLHQAVAAANTAIYTINQKQASAGSNRMGTTLVLVLVHGTEVAVAHIGDSRLYRLGRKRGLEQMTLDHEVGRREIQRGVEPEIAYARPDAYQLTQALGPRDSSVIKPDIEYFTLREDTLLLLCSDGLTDNDLLENYWQSHLMPLLSSQTNLDQGVKQLIELANQYNGHDNTTVVAIRMSVMPDLAVLAM
jgi:protein phosphatase